MRKILSVAVVMGLAWTLPASAVDEHHPEQQKGGTSQTAPKDPKAQPKQTPATKQAPAGVEAGSMPMGMMGNMEKMQEQMRRMMQTQDPKEREKLLREHMQTMQDQMKMMDGMMGNGKGSTGMSPGQSADQRMQMMENRMDMMQKMMEQMLRHQEQKAK